MMVVPDFFTAAVKQRKRLETSLFVCVYRIEYPKLMKMRHIQCPVKFAMRINIATLE